MNPIRVGVLFEGDFFADTVSDARSAEVTVPGHIDFECPRDCAEFAAYFAISEHEEIDAMLLAMCARVNDVPAHPDFWQSEVIGGMPAALMLWRRPLKKGDMVRLRVELRMRREREATELN